MPTPAAGSVVTSVGVADGVAPEVREACREVTPQVRVPVVCPRIYPRSGFVETPGSPRSDAYLRTPEVYAPDFYVLTFNNGNTEGYIHWAVGVGTRPLFDRYIISGRHNEVPGPASRAGHLETPQGTISLYEFKGERGGPNNGHIIAAIQRGDLVVYGSVHGHAHRDLAVALALDAAAQLRRAP